MSGAAAKSRLRPLAVASSMALAILGGLILLGLASRQPAAPGLPAESEIPYGDIACNAPPGQSRREFLDELRYLGLPNALDPRSPEMRPLLRGAFEKHPRVDRILSLEIGPGRIAVELLFKPDAVQSLPPNSASKPGER